MSEVNATAAFLLQSLAGFLDVPGAQVNGASVGGNATSGVTGRLLQALKGNGARAVFGIPGDYALSMFCDIERTNILPLITLSHEPSLGFAADAAARAGRGIGVAAVTYGAGALNLVNPVAAAYAERSPVAVISAAPARIAAAGVLGRHHQVRSPESQLRVFREITCAQAVLDNPQSAPELIARTLRECVRRSLPVYFEVPEDMANASCAPVEKRATAHSDPDAVAECANEIAALVRNAKRPVAMIGVEVRRFGLEDRVAELSRRAQIPVVTSFMGRGVASTASIEIAGSYLGLAGDPAIAKLVEESDALILLGVILCDTNLGLPAGKLDLARVVHVFGGDVRIGHHVYRDVALADLTEALFRHAPASPLLARALHPARKPASTRAPDDAAIHPSGIAHAVDHLFASRGIMPIACDVGDSLFVSLEIASEDLLAQAYYASMGFAVPAAIGIQAATGRRPLVLVGDGAFEMTGWELGNCSRYGFDPIVIVLNNREWGMLRAFAPEAGFNTLSDWHFADLALPLGGEGVRVRTVGELARALDNAWQCTGKFQIIEVMLERGDLSETLRRFTAALGR